MTIARLRTTMIRFTWPGYSQAVYLIDDVTDADYAAAIEIEILHDCAWTRLGRERWVLRGRNEKGASVVLAVRTTGDDGAPDAMEDLCPVEGCGQPCASRCEIYQAHRCQAHLVAGVCWPYCFLRSQGVRKPPEAR